MNDGKDYEDLVARLHKCLDGTNYDVLEQQTIEDIGGAKHSIDVLLRPKGGLSGNILVSCKDWKSPVGV